eukprot:Polyplicarium_translucidae@DN965_c0_g1_i2.p1
MESGRRKESAQRATPGNMKFSTRSEARRASSLTTPGFRDALFRRPVTRSTREPCSVRRSTRTPSEMTDYYGDFEELGANDGIDDDFLRDDFDEESTERRVCSHCCTGIELVVDQSEVFLDVEALRDFYDRNQTTRNSEGGRLFPQEIQRNPRSPALGDSLQQTSRSSACPVEGTPRLELCVFSVYP